MSIVTLTAEEARVLGCLMEKSVTTPDNYPLSLNAVMTACNQTTNRDPIVEYGESVVEQALDSLRAKELTRRVKSTGQRVIKYRHVVEEALSLDRPESTLLGVLLLRGAQTPGELKQRTERWHSFRSLADVEDALGAADRRRRWCVGSSAGPGRRKPRWMQLLAPVDTDAAPVVHRPEPGPTAREPASVSAVFPDPTPAGAVVDREPEPVAQPHSLEVRNPANGDVLRSVAVTETSEIAQKVARARTAQRAWAAREYAERAAALRAFRDLLEREAEECAQLTTSEMGKPIRQSRNEVRAVLERIDWNIDNVGRLLASRDVTTTDGLDERITYEPVGVVAHVSAWNYPYFVGLNSIVPALLAGNAVCYKPSEHATLTGLRIVDLLHRSGVPVDVMHTIVGAGPTGAALVEADVDMVCFTGSYATGPARGARGRRPADPGAARARRQGRGVRVRRRRRRGSRARDRRGCVLQRRPVVQRHRTRLRARVDLRTRSWARWSRWSRAYRVGDPTDDATDVGPLARAEQLDVLEAQLADAAGRGGKVLCGGDRIERPGNWFAPTVVVDVPDGAALMRDESFGPVIGVARVADDAEAVGADGRHRVRARRRRCSRRDRDRARAPALAPRRGQRLLEHRRPFVCAPAVVGPAPLGSRDVDVGVGRAHLRPREGLAPRPVAIAAPTSGPPSRG